MSKTTLITPNGFNIESEHIGDILTSCFEGTATYWIDDIKALPEPIKGRYVSEVLTRNGTIEIEHDNEKTILTLEMFLKGVDTYLAQSKMEFEDSEDLACNGDSDYILQHAIFEGEPIYC